MHVWTINDRQAMHRMIDRGVDNIITDRPAELAAVLRERAALSDVERLALQFGHWLRELRSGESSRSRRSSAFATCRHLLPPG